MTMKSLSSATPIARIGNGVHVNGNGLHHAADDETHAHDARPAARVLTPADLPPTGQRPSREEAMKAVRTLLAWAGDDPTREGLLDTPRRVVEAFGEWFEGYEMDPSEALARTFDEIEGYDDLVMLRDIDVESHCEHHLAPFIGRAHVAYMPKNRVVGISKIARVVQIFSKRLQIQEKLTAQIADAITSALDPRGVAVYIDAKHECMTTRGVHHPNVSTITTRFTGVFKDSAELRERFLRLAQSSSR